MAAPATPADAFTVEADHVAHPWLTSGTIRHRPYQLDVARRCLARNTLVVLPTGLGKTVVAALVVAEALRRGARHVVLLAPTRPLVDQHAAALGRFLRDEGRIQVLSGGTPPAARKERWSKALIVVSTPETVRNDLAAGRYGLAGTDLVVFDEAHHGVGDYAYVEVARRLVAENPKARVLGLTASPGSDAARVAQVQANLHLEDAIHRHDRDAAVRPYVQPTDVQAVVVDLTPTHRRVQRQLRAVLEERIGTLRRLGLLPATGPPWGVSRTDLVKLTKALGLRLGQGQRDAQTFAGLLAAQVALHAHLALELVETQGLEPLRRHLERLASKKVLKRPERSFLAEPRVAAVLDHVRQGEVEPHAKTERLLRLVQALVAERPEAIAVVFAQYRDTVEVLWELLNARGVAAERFTGQAKGRGGGMTQVEQRRVLERFRARQFRVLVSTSVGEEGIDVPQVDLVVFYEAVPSEIRAIQRRGRTGRTTAGRVVVLLARGTRDEAYLRLQRVREGRMRKLVADAEADPSGVQTRL